VVSGDELDDDESPFWQKEDEDGGADGDQLAGEVDAPKASAIEGAASAASTGDANIVNSATEAVRSRSELLTKRLESLQRLITAICTGVGATDKHVEVLTAKLSVSRRRASAMAEKLRVSMQDLDNTSSALATTVLDLEEKQTALSAAENERDTLDAAIQVLGAKVPRRVLRSAPTPDVISAVSGRRLACG
jgi:chromosome segregation ATPase